MRIALFLLCYLLASAADGIAQSKFPGVIKGAIIDSTVKLPLEAATISVYAIADSSLVNYAISDKRGRFEISRLPLHSPFKLIVTYHGYGSVVKYLSLTNDQPSLDLKEIALSNRFTELEQVVVTAEKPPVIYRNDTIEFNAGSFRTRPNATVEELLKKLPGVEVDMDGTIRVNGRKVAKLTVNGKMFFGGDPLMATRNLPKDIVDKIQVSINRSRESLITGVVDGTEELALNIDLDDDKSAGVFGNVTAGYGTRDRYQMGGILNYFTPKFQVSILGSRNNINNRGLDGGKRDFNNGGSGLQESTEAGFNISTQVSEKLMLNGSYSYVASSTQNRTRLKRQNILPDTSFFYNADIVDESRNHSNRFSFDLMYKIDSVTDLYINTSFSANKGNSFSKTQAFSESLTGKLLNLSNNTLDDEQDSPDMGTNVSLNRRLNKRGSGISFGANWNNAKQNSVSLSNGINAFPDPSGILAGDTLNQQMNTRSNNKNLSLSLQWSEPLSKKISLVVGSIYSLSSGFSDRNTYSFDPLTGQYTRADSSLSNIFKSTNQSIAPSLAFNYHGKKINAAISNGLNFFNQDNESLTGKEDPDQRYINILPRASLGYQFSDFSSVNLNYDGRNSPPSVHDLQPVTDNRNPLYIRMGNPDLKQSFAHNYSLNFNINKYSKQTSFSGGLNYNTTSNQIVQEIYFDSIGRQISRPVNTNGNNSASMFVYYNKGWKLSSGRINLGGNSSLGRQANTVISNKSTSRARSYSALQSINLQFEQEELLDVQLRYTIRYSYSDYTTGSNSASPSSLGQSLNLSFSVNITRNISIDNDLSSTYNNRITPGFRKTITNWQAGANWLLFKKQQGHLRLIVYDLLRQNASVSRIVTQTFIEDIDRQMLQQYFLLSFTYNLKHFGK